MAPEQKAGVQKLSMAEMSPACKPVTVKHCLFVGDSALYLSDGDFVFKSMSRLHQFVQHFHRALSQK